MHNQLTLGVNIMTEEFVLNIKVEGGDLFDGSLEQWEDCFFSFPFYFSVNEKLEQIQNYCNGYNYSFTLSWKNKNSLNKTEPPKINVKFQ